MKEGPWAKQSKQREARSLTNYCTSDSINIPAYVAQIRSVSPPCLVAATGEQLLSNVVVNELPTTSTGDTPADNSSTDTDPVIYAALLARIEMLEEKIKRLKSN